MESMPRKDDGPVALGRVAAVGLLVVIVSVGASGIVLPHATAASSVEYTGPLIATSGVLIATIALIGFD